MGKFRRGLSFLAGCPISRFKIRQGMLCFKLIYLAADQISQGPMKHYLSVMTLHANGLVVCLVGIVRRLLGCREKPRGTRFESISNRMYVADLSMTVPFMLAVGRAKRNVGKDATPPLNWKGVQLGKDPFDFTLYTMLLWELKPATIIELGAFKGGSATWLADVLEAQGTDAKIFSFDIDLKRITANHHNVTYIKADLSDVGNLADFPVDSLPHPWLIVEDAHVNVYNIMEFFSKHMMVGDYMIIEDTVVSVKHAAMKDFLLKQGDAFAVDTHYTDMFGYNVTWNINGYIRKMH